MSLYIQCLSIDCASPRELGSFWEGVLEWERIFDSDEEVALSSPEQGRRERMPDLLFLKVPESKSVKNRLHLDLRPHDRDAEVARLLAIGASRVDVGQNGTESWVVLADPEGNEFCILRALGSGDEDYEGPATA
jgi:hypothetical protein